MCALILVSDAARLASLSPAWASQVRCVRQRGTLLPVAEHSLGTHFPKRAAASRGRPVRPYRRRRLPLRACG